MFLFCLHDAITIYEYECSSAVLQKHNTTGVNVNRCVSFGLLVKQLRLNIENVIHQLLRDDETLLNVPSRPLRDDETLSAKPSHIEGKSRSAHLDFTPYIYVTDSPYVHSHLLHYIR